VRWVDEGGAIGRAWSVGTAIASKTSAALFAFCACRPNPRPTSTVPHPAREVARLHRPGSAVVNAHALW